MPIKSYKHLFILLGGIWATAFAYLWFYNSPYFEGVSEWARGNPLWFYGLLFVIKTVGIIWPPIPGGIFTLGSIPIIGWWQAYIPDFLGSLVGSVVAYWIARKWGIRFLRKIFDEEAIKKIEKIKITPKREIEAIFFFRVFGGNVVEIVCYGAGLLKVSFKNYLIGTVFSHLAVGIPSYYFAGELFAGRNILINIAFLIAAGLLFIFFKERYFITDDKGTDKKD